MEVKLSDKAIASCRRESEKRCKHTKAKCRLDHTTQGSSHASLVGTIGEAAVYTITGFKPDGFDYSGNGKAGDVGPLQVRATHRDVLYFKDFDESSSPYVAVKVPKFVDSCRELIVDVVGWRFGWECTKPSWRRTAKDPSRMRPGQKCWWEVPHAELYSLESLAAYCEDSFGLRFRLDTRPSSRRRQPREGSGGSGLRRTTPRRTVQHGPLPGSDAGGSQEERMLWSSRDD